MHMKDYFSLLVAVFLVSHLESSVKLLAGEFVQDHSQDERFAEAVTKDYHLDSFSDVFHLKSSMEPSTILRPLQQKKLEDNLRPSQNSFIYLESLHNNLTLSPTTVLYSTDEVFTSKSANLFPIENQIKNNRSSLSPLNNITEKTSQSNQKIVFFRSNHPSLFGSHSSSRFELETPKIATTFSLTMSAEENSDAFTKVKLTTVAYLKSDDVYSSISFRSAHIDESTSDVHNIYNLQSSDKANVTTISESHAVLMEFRSPIIQTIDFNKVIPPENFTSMILATPVYAELSDSLNNLSASVNLSSFIQSSAPVMLSSESVLPTATMNINASGNVDVSDPSSNSRVSEATRHHLGTGAIVGITMGAIGVVTILAGTFGFLIYHWRFRSLSSLESKYPTDNCGYVDDTLRVSYINNHVELPKESSEEMFSLDNDSFLNSLEAMTLQNYWAEDAKNTKKTSFSSSDESRLPLIAAVGKIRILNKKFDDRLK